MKKVLLMSFVATLALTSVFAGGKGDKKCCKKEGKECTDKAAPKPQQEAAKN